MPATDGTWRIALAQDAGYRRPIAHAAIASILVAVAAGMFLLARRADGALDSPLPAPQLVVTAVVLLAWSMFVRVSLRRSRGPMFWLWLPTTALLLFAVACSYPGGRIVDWLVWLPTFAALLFADRAVNLAGRPRRPGVPASGEPAFPATVIQAADEQIVQQLTRYRTPTGQDVVRGTLAAEFAIGQRNVTLYVAFCPPFERLPHVEIDVDDASSATAKLAQVLHNGVQVDVRLLQTAGEPRCVSIELFAAEPTDTL